MAVAGAARLGVVEFGAELLRTGDLDPVYIAVHRLRLQPEQLLRWLLAYWCFYRADVASALSEQRGSEFFAMMRRADERRWPRGRERRHFRGTTSRNAIEYLAQAHRTPEDAVEWLCRSFSLMSFVTFKSRIEAWPGFGPWIAFKAADMLERLDVMPITFSWDILSWYGEPRAGAELAAQHLGAAMPPTALDAAATVRQRLAEAGFLAPPACDRPIDIQEVETVLCKWKSHLNGHYPVGIDTRELRVAAAHGANPECPWHSDTGARLAALIPPADSWW